MDCRAASAPCACAVAGGAVDPPARVRLLVASGTRHTLTAVQRSAEDTGALVRRDGGLLDIVATDRATLLAGIDAALTSTEKQEARAVEVPEDAALAHVAAALAAPTLAAHCARTRERPLARALRSSDSFWSVYQPIVDLRSGAAVAFEALLRASVDGAPLLPGPMFEAAEEAGWLHVLDRIGREAAIRGAAGWLGDADLFVNFNPTSIYRPEVCLATTERAIAQADLRMGQLVFEVVESHAVGDMAHLLRVLRHYRELGCRVAMDDVGAGYASLTSLVRVSPEVVKLDRELVQALPDRAAVAIVRSIVALAHDMEATVVAECLETAEQVRVVVDLGVDLGQGWFFARPSRLPREEPVAALPTVPALTGAPA